MAIKGTVKNDDYWNSLEIIIDDPMTGYVKSLNGYDEILRYFQREVNYWQPLAAKYSVGPLNQIAAWLQNILDDIESVKENNDTTESGKTTTKAKLESVAISINTLGKNANSQHYIPSKTTEAILIVSLAEYSTDAIEGAFKFYANESLPTNISEAALGYMQAATLEATKKNIGEPADHLRKSFDDVRNNIEAWHDKSIVKVDKQFEKAEKKINDLEQTYGDKLMLEEPAQNWKDRAKTLRSIGYGWSIALIAASVTMIRLLASILLQEDNPFLGNLFSEGGLIDANSLRGLLILVAIISFGAYLIRTAAKLLFSSFHLARDAEERYYLTMVYLGLRQNASVTDKDREIILQALFARADTGLIGDDGGPTMPGGAIFDTLRGRS